MLGPWLAPYLLTKEGLMLMGLAFVGGPTIATWMLQIAWTMASTTTSWSWAAIKGLYNLSMGPHGEGPVLDQAQIDNLVKAGQCYNWTAAEVNQIWLALKAEELVLQHKEQPSTEDRERLLSIDGWVAELKTATAEDTDVWHAPINFLYMNARLEGRWFYEKINKTRKTVLELMQYARNQKPVAEGDGIVVQNASGINFMDEYTQGEKAGKSGVGAKKK